MFSFRSFFQNIFFIRFVQYNNVDIKRKVVKTQFVFLIQTRKALLIQNFRIK